MDVELLAQVGDVGLEHASIATEVVVPDVVEELGAGEHESQVAHEVAQQPVLRGRQLDVRSRAGDLTGVLVELEVLEDEAARVRLRVPRAAQDRAHARDELLQAEGLGHIVVPSRGEAADLVLGRVARGEEDDRHSGALGAEPPRDLEALHVRQHHVEQQQVRLEGAHRGQRVATRSGRLHPEPLEAQRHGDHVDDVRLVVDDEDAEGGGG